MAFLAAALALITTFATSAAPIPLYGLYRETEGLTYNDLSLTAVAYFAGALTALLVFGRVSNHLGRRPVVLISLGLAAAACLVLLHVSGLTPIVIGRILLGLACGLASSATVASVQDNAPQRRSWLAAAVVSTGPMVGLTIGAVVSGTLVDFAPAPRSLPYLVMLLGLACSAVLVLSSRETMSPRAGLLRSLRPRLALSGASRRRFPVASCTFVATWALGGFYQAFSPAITTDQLGTSSALISALVFSSFLGPTALGGPLGGRMSAVSAQRAGMVVFTAALAIVLVCLRAGVVIPFLIASAVAGVGQGMTLTGSIRTLLADTGADQRAGTFAAIFATSYSGAAIPSLVAGQASRVANLLEIATGYGALALLCCIVTLAAARAGEKETMPVIRSVRR